MEGYSEFAEGIQHDQVIKLLVAVEINPAIAINDADPVSLMHAEIFRGSCDHSGIDLDDVDLQVRHRAAEVGRDDAGTEADHQNSLDRLRVKEAHRYCL